MQDSLYGFGHWHMGHDYQYRLTSEREPGVYNATKFTLVKNADGIIADEFDYMEPNGNGTGLRRHHGGWHRLRA